MLQQEDTDILNEAGSDSDNLPGSAAPAVDDIVDTSPALEASIDDEHEDEYLQAIVDSLTNVEDEHDEQQHHIDDVDLDELIAETSQLIDTDFHHNDVETIYDSSLTDVAAPSTSVDEDLQAIVDLLSDKTEFQAPVGKEPVTEDVFQNEVADSKSSISSSPSASLDEDLQAIIDSLAGDTDSQESPATESLAEDSVAEDIYSKDYSKEIVEPLPFTSADDEDLQSIIDSLAKAMDEQTANETSNEGAAETAIELDIELDNVYRDNNSNLIPELPGDGEQDYGIPLATESAVTTDSVLPGDDTLPTADTQIDYDADIDAIIKSLSTGTETTTVALQDDSVLSTDELILRIESLWQTLQESWQAVRRQPHLVTKIEDLWQLLKNSDQFDDNLPPELAAIMAGSDETSPASSYQDEDLLAILQDSTASPSMPQTVVEDEISTHETNHSDAQEILDTLLEQHEDELPLEKSQSYESIEDAGPALPLEGQQTADMDELDIMVGILGDSLDVEQYKAMLSRQDQTRKVAGDQIESTKEQSKSAFDDDAADTNTINADELLTQLLQESQQAEMETPVEQESSTQSSTQSTTKPASSPASVYQSASSASAVKSDTAEYKPAAGGDIQSQSLHFAADTTSLRSEVKSGVQSTDNEDAASDSTSLMPWLAAAGIGAIAFVLWSLLTPEEKQRTAVQTQPTRVAAAKKAEREEFFLPDNAGMRILSSVEVMKREDSSNTYSEQQEQSSKPAYSKNRFTPAADPGFVEQRYIPETVQPDYSKYAVDSTDYSKYAADSTSPSTGIYSASAPDTQSNGQSNAQNNQSYSSVYSDTTTITQTEVVDMSGPIKQLKQSTSQGLDNLSERVGILERAVSGLKSSIESLLGITESNSTSTGNLLGTSQSNRDSIDKLLGATKNNRDSIDKLLGATQSNQDSIDKLLSITESNRDSNDKLLVAMESNRASIDSKISDLGERISTLNESYKEAIYAMAQIQKGQDGVTIVLRDPENIARLQDANGQPVKHITHTVAKGDTLWAIAKRYINNPYRYPELARLSKIKNPDRIYPGDKVHIIIRDQ